MHGVEVLILHGSPGSGKSALAEALAELLRESDQPNAVIDLDELSRVYPSPPPGFSRRNLKAMWPNYLAIPGLRVLIPTVIADQEDLKLLLDALPSSHLLICELDAPLSLLKARVAAREPNEYWQKRLEKWVNVYHKRDNSQKFGDFRVHTGDKSVQDSAQEIIEKAGWST